MSLQSEILFLDGTNTGSVAPQGTLQAVLKITNPDAVGYVINGFTINAPSTLATVGTLPFFSPVTYTTQSAGTPVTSSVANPFAPNSQNIRYYPYNISGSVTSAPIRYTGTQEIASLGTSSIPFAVFCNINVAQAVAAFTSNVDLGGTKLNGLVTYVPTGSFVNPPVIAPVTTSYAAEAEVVYALNPQAFVSTTTQPRLVVLDGSYPKPANASNYDAVVQSAYIVTPDIQIALPPEGANYSSSNTAVATVVQSGNFTSTTAGAGGFTQFIGGGGAVSFVGTGDVEITNAIQNGVTGSVLFKVVEFAPVRIAINPTPIVGTFSGSAGLPKAQLICQGFASNGKSDDITSIVSWSTSNSNIATVNSNGLVTAVSNTPNAVTVYATLNQAGVITLQDSVEVVINRQLPPVSV